MSISHKLYKGHHLLDVPSKENMPSQIGKMKGKVSKTILESGPSAATFVPRKLELLSRIIRSHENMLVHLYEQQQFLKLQLQGILKQCKEITTSVIVLKKSND